MGLAKRSIKITGALPSKRDLFMAVCADYLTKDYNRGRKFYECFKPTPAQRQVYDTIENSPVAEDKWLHYMVYGDTGGGKTWTALGYALKCMMEHPGCQVLVIRETMGDLKLTTYGDVMRFFSEWGIKIARKNETYGNIELENGSIIYFRSDKALLKHDKDKSDSLGGTQFSVVIFEEADSTSRETYRTISGRMRQNVGVKRKVVFAICNPPTPRHWLFQMFNRPDRVAAPPETKRWFVSQMFAKDNPHARKGYLEAKMEDWDEDDGYRRRMGEGQAGPETKGIPYFRRNWSKDHHVTAQDLRASADRRYPIWRGWDFGYNYPAMVLLQDDTQRGQIRVLWSQLEQNMSTWDMMEHWLPRLRQEFDGFRFIDACDPQGVQIQSATGLSDIQVMNSFGVYPITKKTRVEYGLSIIDKQLAKNAYQGNPSILIDSRCEDLIDSFDSGYCVKEDNKTGELVINKDGVYDHIMDCFRYLMVQIRDPGWEYSPWADQHRGDEWNTLMDRETSKEFYNRNGQVIIGGPPRNPLSGNPMGQPNYVRGKARRRY